MATAATITEPRALGQDPMRPAVFAVKKSQRETADTFTLVLEPPEASGGVFPFAPGQFNMLYVFGVGEVPI